MGGRDDYQNYMGGEEMGDDDTDGEGEPPMKTVLIIGEDQKMTWLVRSSRTVSTTRREIEHWKEQSRQKHNPRVRVLRESCVRGQRPLQALALLKNSMAPTPGDQFVYFSGRRCHVGDDEAV